MLCFDDVFSCVRFLGFFWGPFVRPSNWEGMLSLSTSNSKKWGSFSLPCKQRRSPSVKSAARIAEKTWGATSTTAVSTLTTCLRRDVTIKIWWWRTWAYPCGLQFPRINVEYFVCSALRCHCGHARFSCFFLDYSYPLLIETPGVLLDCKRGSSSVGAAKNFPEWTIDTYGRWGKRLLKIVFHSVSICQIYIVSIYIISTFLVYVTVTSKICFYYLRSR